MTLVRGTGGKLLRKANGALARDTSCCCDAPPPLCPSCCIAILWGSFDANGDLIEVFPDLQVTLVMPTKNSRIVCDGEQVAVRLEFLDVDENSVEADHLPYVRWDRSWIYQSHTPAVTAGGTVITDGLIEWRGLHFDMVAGEYASTYEVVLEYDHCWADYLQQWGDIEAGDRNGNFTLITGDFCDDSVTCCDTPVTCEPCCYYLSPSIAADAYEFKNNKAVFWAEAGDGSQLKVEVGGLDATKRTVCFAPGTLGAIAIDLDIEFIPTEVDPANPHAPQVGVGVGAWTIDAYSPAVGNGTAVLDPPPRSITWGTDVTARDYTVDLSIKCDVAVSGLPTIEVSTQNPPMTINIEFLECPNPNNWDCCCECFPCEFPEVGAITSLVWTCDDGNYAVVFTQDATQNSTTSGCEFSVPGTWTVTDLTGVEPDNSYPGTVTVRFENGDWILDGGTQNGIVFEATCPGTCSGGQSCDYGCTISFDANGAECQPEGEP